MLACSCSVGRRDGRDLPHADDLSRDGRAVLFTVGPFDTPVGARVYATRFDGGEPRLLVRNASEPSWAR